MPAILYSKKTHNIKWNNAQGRNCIKKSCNTSVTVFVVVFFLLSNQGNNKIFPKKTSWNGFVAVHLFFIFFY